MLWQKAVFSIWNESWEHVKNKWTGEIKQEYKALVTMSDAQGTRIKQGQRSGIEIVYIDWSNRSKKSRRL